MEAFFATTTARKGFFRRLISWRGALFLLAAFITLVALMWAEENWRGARAWQNYKHAMEAKGESFDAARLIPAKVPDDQNFAMTPLFKAIFDLPLGDPERPLKTVTNTIRGETYEHQTGANLGANITLPIFDLNVDRPIHPVEWKHGMASDLIAWAKAIRAANPHSSPVEITDPTQAASIVLDSMKTAEPALAQLQSDATRPHCRFDINYFQYDNPEKFTDLMHHFVMIKWLYRLLSLHAEAEMVAGRADLALNDVNLMFRLDDGLKEEPLLISQLVHFAVTSIMLDSVGEGLAEHRWSDAQLQVLEDRLQKTDLIASTVRALHGERDICVNPKFDAGTLNPDGRTMMPRGWVRLEQLSINRAADELLFPRIDLPGRVISPSVNHSFDVAFKKFSEGNWFNIAFVQHCIFAKMLLPALSHAPLKTAVVQSEVDLATVACALERYRLAEGGYPQELNSLVPRFIVVLPHDIINGQPLKYRLTDDGRYILYSIGWNEKDDGGTVALTKGKHQDPLQGDWVWQYP